MKSLINLIILTFFGLSLSCAQTQEQHEHEAHHASLDAHLTHVQQVEDPAERKRMLRMHIQMMKKKMEAMASMEHGGMGGMDHGEGGMGGGMGGMDHGEGGMGGGMGGMNHGEGGMGDSMGGMNHGEGGMGGMNHGEGGMGGGMMQHHNAMVNRMQQMISVQEMLLDMIDN